MSDATREEAIQWCIDNKVDFKNTSFPPPDGWMWGDTGSELYILTTIFTNTEDEDINSFDVENR